MTVVIDMPTLMPAPVDTDTPVRWGLARFVTLEEANEIFPGPFVNGKMNVASSIFDGLVHQMAFALCIDSPDIGGVINMSSYPLPSQVDACSGEVAHILANAATYLDGYNPPVQVDETPEGTSDVPYTAESQYNFVI